MMDYASFLARVCNDGREAAAESYSHPDQADKLEGSQQGFLEASLTQSPDELLSLLTRANHDCQEAFMRQDERYWFYRCRALEIEWTANVVSAALMNSGLPIIVNPTARGVFKAAEILGVASQ